MEGVVMAQDQFRLLAVPFSRGAARTARVELARELRASAVRQSVIDDALVVLSELVTNAVRHAKPGPNGQVGVEYALEPQRLWLRVSDGGRREPVADRTHVHESVGGRGLSIVAALADSWDFERDESGTTVTAVFDLV